MAMASAPPAAATRTGMRNKQLMSQAKPRRQTNSKVASKAFLSVKLRGCKALAREDQREGAKHGAEALAREREQKQGGAEAHLQCLA